jgi:hypothetical protein
MRDLWPIERTALEETAKDNPALADCLRQQADRARVTAFENSGAGFFSSIRIEGDVPPLPEQSHLNGAYGSVDGIEHGMGFIVFLEGGRVSLIEGYCNGNVSSEAIDFSSVDFEIKPWSQAIV